MCCALFWRQTEWILEATLDDKDWHTLHSTSGVTDWADHAQLYFRLDASKDEGLQHYFFNTPNGVENGYQCNDVGSALVYKWTSIDPLHTFPETAAVTNIGMYTVFGASARGCNVRTCTDAACSEHAGTDVYYETTGGR